MQNAPAVVRQHQEHIQDLEPDGRYRKEVDGNHALHVVGEEGPPGLRRLLEVPRHILAHTGLADVDTELKQFAMNARSTPRGFSRLMVRINARTS